MLRDELGGAEATWGRVEEGAMQRDVRCAQLHRRLKRIVNARGALDAQEAEAVREADKLRVWRHYGYASLIEYMEMEMGYTPRAAVERLRVAHAIVELPAIAEAMAQGDLSFSARRELTRVATADTEQQWLEAASDKKARQIKNLVSGRNKGAKPTDPADPKLRTRRMTFEAIDEETAALMRQAREILERELGGRMDDKALLRARGRMVVDGARTPERTHAPYQIAVTTCIECKRGWQDGGGITVEMSPATLEVALCDAVHIGSVDADASTGMAPARAKSATAPARATTDIAPPRAKPDIAAARAKSDISAPRATSDIPPALRRKVRARDHHTCRVPCWSSRSVDQRHMIPVSEGGQHALENLITLCESHHLAHHEGALLIGGKRRPRDSRGVRTARLASRSARSIPRRFCERLASTGRR